nr:hypothetical protein [uncultured Rhodopila sp.]
MSPLRGVLGQVTKHFGQILPIGAGRQTVVQFNRKRQPMAAV